MVRLPDELLEVSRPWGERRLTIELSRAARYGRALSIALLDVDQLAVINDMHGVEVGDLVIGQFAELIAGNLRLPDEAGRHGDDEFLVLFPETAPSAAVAALERLDRAAQRHRWGLDGEAEVRFSAGVASPGVGGERGAAELIVEAREAMHAAKAAGGGRILVAGAIPAPRLELITS